MGACCSKDVDDGGSTPKKTKGPQPTKGTKSQTPHKDAKQVERALGLEEDEAALEAGRKAHRLAQSKAQSKDAPVFAPPPPLPSFKSAVPAPEQKPLATAQPSSSAPQPSPPAPGPDIPAAVVAAAPVPVTPAASTVTLSVAPSPAPEAAKVDESPSTIPNLSSTQLPTAALTAATVLDVVKPSDDVKASPAKLPPPPTSQPPKVANVLASLLPKDDVEANRKAREELLQSNEVVKPKMMEFDINFEDDDLLVIEDGDENSAEIVEDFSVDDESTPKKKSGDPLDSPPQDLRKGGAFEGVEKPIAKRDIEEMKLDKNWFVERGVVPPKSVVWKQTKSEVFITIAPADKESGWELLSNGSVLDFTSYVGGRNIRVMLPLLHSLVNARFTLDAGKQELHFVGQKVCNDEDDEALPYWTQLIRGSRKDYAAIPFISRAMDEDEDEDDFDENNGKKPEPYKYGQMQPPADGAAFSDPESD